MLISPTAARQICRPQFRLLTSLLVPPHCEKTREKRLGRRGFGHSVENLTVGRKQVSKLEPPAQIANRSRIRAQPLAEPQSEESSVEQELAGLLKRALSVLRTSDIPDEAAVLSSMRACESFARSLIQASRTSELASGSKPLDKNSPASNLLSLDEYSNSSSDLPPSRALLVASIRKSAVEKISNAAHTMITDPNVFITSDLLTSYVNTQTLLGHPETLPQAFKLYANKPAPTPNTSPIQYSTPNPDKPAIAIDDKTANTALGAAIDTKNLALCLDVIESTVCTTAYRRAKIFRRAALPISAVFLAPLATYAVASQLSHLQNTMDPTIATNVAFAGVLTYLGATATMGYVTITTANDQMDRVTWATGMPLRERWLREEERAMLDRVACAWGFKERSKRGEEEGQEWSMLREWIGLRGMILDRAELMEGME
ncbi:hypothetical protein MMC20_003505 [Loxospora ochrophaea]|nr:hypothetical protein [Loxospora ochrophaea]